MLRGKLYQRKDVEIKNDRGDVLQCSHYLPFVSPGGKPLPCVIYCHGNSGCRADASEAAIILLPSNITVFTLDFSGSGLSGGDHVTLGWYEKDDLRSVVDYLRQDGNVSLIGLWGRSMGAVTSLMYGAQDPSIAGMVLDSPFSDLVDLMMELVDAYKFRLPKFTVAQSCFVPALFGHAIEDDFIQPHHSDQIYEAYMGDKNIIKFEGDHNSPRPQFYFDSINIFFHNVLQPPEDDIGGPLLDTMFDYFGKDRLKTAYNLGHKPESSVAPKAVGPSATSTEDAIEQVRARRPMSRIEVPSDIPSEDEKSETQDVETDDDHVPSSSQMINFELSNGTPYGPHVPTTADDDQFVEYELDDLTGVPSNAEEEERMLMEAIIASLKDMELPANASGTELAVTESSQSTPEATPSKTEPCDPPVNVPTSTSEDEHTISKKEPTPAIMSNSNSSSMEESRTSSSRSDTSTGNEADLSGKTKATVIVERNPPTSTHIIDGLMRRWDFNLFRNNR
ncbi:Uncharacterized protein YqkD [Linum perenne]